MGDFLAAVGLILFAVVIIVYVGKGIIYVLRELFGSDTSDKEGCWGLIFFAGIILICYNCYDSCSEPEPTHQNVNFKGNPSRTGGCYTHSSCKHFTPVPFHNAKCECGCDIWNHSKK